MNRDQKAAVIDEVAGRIQAAQAIIAVDYRGLSVKQAVELRQRLSEAGAQFQVVKNRLTIRAADKAGAEDLKAFLEGPTAFAYVEGDAAVAAKAIATFRRQNNLLAFKGGTMDGDVLSVDEIEAIAKLPARDTLNSQFVGVLASPITGLVRGLASMIGGLASQLQQIADQGLVAGADEGEAEHAEGEAEHAEGEAEHAEGEAEQEPAAEAPGDPVAEAETADAEGEAQQAEAETADAEGEAQQAEAETETETSTPSEGEKEQEG